MTFEEIVDQAIAMLQRRGRVAYRTLKRQFQLDDEALDDLKTEIIKAQRLAVDEDGVVLVWIGGPTSPWVVAGEPTPAPRLYTPAHLAERILLSEAALEGERKQVTVLFADLKASMELLADRDPEEARQLLDPVLERMMAAVHCYEGTVNQVMGDGIMAMFGAPIAHEDHAVRACYAALAMQDAIRRYSEEVRRTHGITVQMRVGLNSGEVVVRAIGNDLHMDYSAIGQTTHLAARMEQLATPGSTLLTAETLQLAEGFIQVKALGPVPVKGLTAPVEVFELAGATAIRQRLQAAVARGLTRFVGRETELEALQHALERAGAGHGQVVAVMGEAGVGKSRLVYECFHSHRLQGWLVLESTSVSYNKATPYFPVIDLLKRYAHVQEGDDARTMRTKVTAQVLALDEALQEVIPALLALLDALPEDSPFQQLEPPHRRQRTLDALKRVLLHESQAQPLVLVFEDLHWIDSETQALIDSLVESLPTARLLLLVNYRPEYQHSWGSKTYYTQLRLDPLPAANAEELLEALLGNDVSLVPLKQLLITRTEGNPFFLEESVRTLVETGVMVGEPGVYQLAQALPTVHVPATVQAALAARIDRLPVEEKCLLQTTAVIGHEVPLRLLQAIAELPEDAIHCGLTRLQTAEFLYETRLFPELEYIFKHALTHEVANLASCHAELGAFREGRTFGDEGLRIAKVVDHPGSLMVALWGIGVLALQQGDLSTAIPQLEHGLDICQGMDLPVWFPRMAPPLGAAYTLAGRVANAVPLLAQALEQALAEETVHYQAFCRLSLGEVQRRSGRLDEAYVLAEQALTLACERQERGHQAYALRLLGEIATNRAPPEVEQAERYYLQALSLAEELGMRPLQAHCHLGCGALYAKIGRYQPARAKLSIAIELYRGMDMIFWLPEAEAVLAEATLAEVEGR